VQISPSKAPVRRAGCEIAPMRRRPTALRKRYLLLLLILLALAAAHRPIGRLLFPLPFYDLLTYHATHNGLDPYLVAAVVRVESNFDPRARSARGALGLMQVMPETGAWMARQLEETDFDPERLFEPEFNVRLGTRYMAHLLREFGGDTVLVLAAYNAGTGQVKEWLARAEWTGEGRTVDQIPFPETRQFVRKVLWYQQVYRYLYGAG